MSGSQSSPVGSVVRSFMSYPVNYTEDEKTGHRLTSSQKAAAKKIFFVMTAVTLGLYGAAHLIVRGGRELGKAIATALRVDSRSTEKKIASVRNQSKVFPPQKGLPSSQTMADYVSNHPFLKRIDDQTAVMDLCSKANLTENPHESFRKGMMDLVTNKGFSSTEANSIIKDVLIHQGQSPSKTTASPTPTTVMTPAPAIVTAVPVATSRITPKVIQQVKGYIESNGHLNQSQKNTVLLAFEDAKGDPDPKTKFGQCMMDLAQQDGFATTVQRAQEKAQTVIRDVTKILDGSVATAKRPKRGHAPAPAPTGRHMPVHTSAAPSPVPRPKHASVANHKPVSKAKSVKGSPKKNGVFKVIDTIKSSFDPRALPIDIGDCRRFKNCLNEQNLLEVFEIAHEHTVNKAHHLEQTSEKINGTLVHRPNHNGTHLMRQVFYTDQICELIENKGTHDAQTRLRNLNKENLKLAVYLLRAGRENEGHGRNAQTDTNHKVRSAQIYEAYAEQLGIDAKTIEMTKNVIAQSAAPWEFVPDDLKKDPEFAFLYSIVSTAHELDLVRCYPPSKLDAKGGSNEHIEGHLGYLLGQPNTTACKDRLVNFAKEACIATGESIHEEAGKPSRDRRVFVSCSNKAKNCYKAIQTNVQAPDWTK
jgi:SidE phosphodiesterase (PDE) domain